MTARAMACIAAVLLLAGTVHSQTTLDFLDEGSVEWVSYMSYAKQVPAINASRATGTAFYNLVNNADFLAVNFTVYIANTNVPGISNDSRTFDLAHIHVGGPTTAGPILVVLFSNATGGPVKLKPPVSDQRQFLLAEGVITEEDFALPGWNFEEFLGAMDNGTLYTNVHTSRYPSGELRGQIEPLI